MGSRDSVAGTESLGAVSPLTPVQFLAVGLCLLAAAVVMVHKDRLPLRDALQRRIRAHTYHSLAARARTSTAWNRAALVASLRGRPTLVVGDSAAREWPWPADQLCLPGHTSPQIARCFREAIGQRRYHRIYVWTGSSHFALGSSVNAYLESTLDLVRMAQAHADQVVLLTPMPYDTAQFQRWIAEKNDGAVFLQQWGEVIQLDTTQRIGEARARLARMLPDVATYDVEGLREWALRQGEGKAYYKDGIHLTSDGFAALGGALDALGVGPEQ